MSDITLAIGVEAGGAVQSVNALSDALNRLSMQGSGALDITGKISQAWRGGDSFGGISQQFDRLNGSIQQVSQSIDNMGTRLVASINGQTQTLNDAINRMAAMGTAFDDVGNKATASLGRASQSTKNLTVEFANLDQKLGLISKTERDRTINLEKLNSLNERINVSAKEYNLRLEQINKSVGAVNSSESASADIMSRLNAAMDKATAAHLAQVEAKAKAGAATDDLTSKTERNAKATAMNGGALRETFVMLHELGTGQTSRLAGSAWVLLAERTNIFQSALQGATMTGAVTVGAFAVMTGGLIAMAAAALQGAAAMNQLKAATQAAGGGIGLTPGQIDQMAMSASTHVATSNYRTIGIDAINSGNISSDALKQIMNMSADYAAVTAKSVEEAGADLNKLAQSPARSLQELADKYHVVTYAQVEYVKRLQESGQFEQAQSEYLRIESERLQGLADVGLNNLGKALRDGAELWKSWWDAAQNLGKSDTIEQQIEVQRARVDKKGWSFLQSGAYRGDAIERKALDDLVTKSAAAQTEALAASVSANNQRQISAGMAIYNQSLPDESQRTTMEDRIAQTERAIKANQDEADALLKTSGQYDDAAVRIAQYDSQSQHLTDTLGNLRARFDNLKTAIDSSNDALQTAITLSNTPMGQRRNNAATSMSTYDRAKADGKSDDEAMTLAMNAVQTANVGATTATVDETYRLNRQADFARKRKAAGDDQAKLRTISADEARFNATFGKLDTPETGDLGNAAAALAALNFNTKGGKGSSKGEDATARILAQADAEKKLADAWATGNVAEVHRVELDKQIALASVGKTDEQAAEIDAALRQADAAKQLDTAEQHRFAQMQQTKAANQNASYLGMGQDAAARAKAENEVTNWYERQYGAISQLSPEIKAVYQDELARADAIAAQTAAYESQKAALDELGKFGDQVFERLGSSLTQAFTQGNGAAINFKSILQGIESEIIQEMVKLAAINPIKNMLSGGSSLPTLGSVMSAVGGSSGQGVIQLVGGSTPGMMTSSGGRLQQRFHHRCCRDQVRLRRQ